MKCCADCFTDEKARQLINALADESEERGFCDICGKTGRKLLELAPESELAEQFADLLGVFETPDEHSRTVFPSLYEALNDTWGIFRVISLEAFDSLLESMFPDDDRIKGMSTGRVCLSADVDPKRSESSTLRFFGDRDWAHFSEEIKYAQRYHAKIKNEDILKRLLLALEIKISPSSRRWYRARFWNRGDRDPVVSDLTEPPRGHAANGRMNPEGVPYLYVSDSPDCAISEIRAVKHDRVAVMEMVPKEPLRILDLSKIDSISPFDENVDCNELASNKENLRQIKEALVKPMRTEDDFMEYVPTQYIADFAKSMEFDGIGYESVLYENNGVPAYNVASFVGFKEAFEKCNIAIYYVNDIDRKIKLERRVT